MPQELSMLAVVAAGIAFVHTLAGPDHYVPFLAMARARDWSHRKTALVTCACGAGHVASSVALAALVALAVVGTERMLALESLRGELAAWGLIAFGSVYAVWGVRRALRNRPHAHWHAHDDGTVHEHRHVHHGGHLHPHERPARPSLTPWVLFTIFLFGPCEPLIPILMVPAAAGDWFGFAAISGLFAAVTVATMLAAVFVALHGLRRIRMPSLERWSSALAGASIAACGFAIVVLGL
jgi:ABC-type nickel/cobalt efflux system permease component RcnA